MVKVIVELFKTQIQMLIHCIEGALDIKHMLRVITVSLVNYHFFYGL